MLATPRAAAGTAEISLMHPVLAQVLAEGFVHLTDVGTDTLAYARSLGQVFHPLKDKSPIVTLKIDGNDAERTPYASCRTPALSLHTDYATFPDPPRFTITHCIETDPEFPCKGVSIVLLLQPVIEHLRSLEPGLLALLRSEVFPFERNADHSLYHSTVPTYSIMDRHDRVRFDRTLVVPHLERCRDPDRRQRIEAIERFEDLCLERAERIEIALNRHEALIIDNRHVLHSRGQCTVRCEGARMLSREVNLAFLV